MVTIPITLKCTSITKLNDHTHSMPFLLYWCGWLNNVWRFWADNGGWSGKATGSSGVCRDVAACRQLTRPAGMFSGALISVCPRIGNNGMSLIHEGWSHVNGIQRERLFDRTGIATLLVSTLTVTWASVDECRTVREHNIARSQRQRSRNSALSRHSIVIWMWREQVLLRNDVLWSWTHRHRWHQNIYFRCRFVLGIQDMV